MQPCKLPLVRLRTEHKHLPILQSGGLHGMRGSLAISMGDLKGEQIETSATIRVQITASFT